jgi:hypothetical protein
MRPFPHVPAVILAAAGGRRLPIHLFPSRLADVADPQIARPPIEGVAPRIAQPVGPDLGQRTGRRHEGVVRRDPVGRPVGGSRVDPEHLAEERPERLRVAARIAAAAAVAESYIEVSVRSEHEVAAVVVGIGLIDEQHLPPGRHVRSIARHRVLDDTCVAVDVREVDVERSAVR